MFARSRAGLWVPKKVGVQDKISLLANFDGAAGDTTFVDQSIRTKTISSYGGAILSSSQKPIGVNTSLFPNGGYAQIGDDTDFDFGSDDFTLEALIYPTSTSGYAAIMSRLNGVSQNSNFAFQMLRSGSNLQFEVFFGNNPAGSVFSGLATNVWQHIAFCRVGATLYASVDGTIKNTSDVGTQAINNPAGAVLQIGQTMTYYPWGGYIGPIRVIKGVGLYSSDFTPPTPPFPAA